MSNKRLVLLLSLGLVGLLLWQAWKVDQKQGLQIDPAHNTPHMSDIPQTTTSNRLADNQSLTLNAPRSKPSFDMNVSELLLIENSVLKIYINPSKAQIIFTQFKDHPNKTTQKPYQFIDPKKVSLFDQLETTDQITSVNIVWQIKSTQNNEIVLTQKRGGILIEKRFSLSPDQYFIQIDYGIENTTQNSLRAGIKMELRYPTNLQTSSTEYLKSAIFANDLYQTISPDDRDEQVFRNVISTGGYAATFESHFIAAIVPKPAHESHYFGYQSDYSAIGVITPQQGIEILPNQAKTLSIQILNAPKSPKILASVKALDRTVDYGFLGFLGRPLFWLLEYIFQLVGSWGLAIILLTCVVKLVFYKPSEMSYKSMAKMRLLQPRMERLKEMYKENKTQMSQKIMALYKEEKINPLGGCLPILFQIPVFIVLYWVLLETVELRMTPFLWINDLSAHDPFYILPIIMGLSMLIQQRLSPKPTDPIQAKVMMVLPVIFTVFFVFFPAGLVLYWVTNNVISILQQWFINKRIAAKGR